VRRPNWPRLVTSVLLAAGVALFIAGFASGGSGRPKGLPVAIVSFSPGSGDRVLRQSQISVELQPIYTGVLVIDGQEVTATYPREQRNILTFQAGPGAEVTEFAPGLHTVRLEYWKQTESRDSSQTYTWSFSTN